MLLDLRMPQLGGLGVLERIQEQLPDTRVVIMSASEKTESLLDAVGAGAAGYLTKRTSGEELRQAVITAHGGGSVITPALASHLLREFSNAARVGLRRVQRIARDPQRIGAQVVEVDEDADDLRPRAVQLVELAARRLTLEVHAGHGGARRRRQREAGQDEREGRAERNDR